MTIPILWPIEEESVTSDLPLGTLRLKAKAPSYLTTSIGISHGGGAPGGLRYMPTFSELPLGHLLLAAKPISSKSTARARTFLPLGQMRTRCFRPTYKVRYSEVRQAEDDEALALICALIH